MMSIAASVEYIKIIAVLEVHICGYWVVLKLVCGGKTNSFICDFMQIRSQNTSTFSPWCVIFTNVQSVQIYMQSYTIEKQIFKSTKKTQFKPLKYKPSFHAQKETQFKLQ
jgi:hypothetical protein